MNRGFVDVLRSRSIVAGTTLVSLFAASLAAPAAAQQDAQMPAMVRVLAFQTELGNPMAYETGIKDLYKGFEQAGVDFPIFGAVSMTNPGEYTFVMPMQSFADLDHQNQLIGKAMMGPSAAAMTQLNGMTVSSTEEIWMARPDLGYAPSNPRLSMEEGMLTHLALLRPTPEHAMALGDVIKKAAAAYKKHGIQDGFEVFELALGADGPAYAILTRAKDMADYYAQNAKNQQKMGADWQAILAQTGPMVRSVSFAADMSRPDLSFQP
jgi:hypothetical protein